MLKVIVLLMCVLALTPAVLPAQESDAERVEPSPHTDASGAGGIGILGAGQLGFLSFTFAISVTVAAGLADLYLVSGLSLSLLWAAMFVYVPVNILLLLAVLIILLPCAPLLLLQHSLKEITLLILPTLVWRARTSSLGSHAERRTSSLLRRMPPRWYSALGTSGDSPF